MEENEIVLPEGSKTLGEVVDECHSLVHEVSFNIDNGNTELAKDQLRKIDLLLHDI